MLAVDSRSGRWGQRRPKRKQHTDQSGALPPVALADPAQRGAHTPGCDLRARRTVAHRRAVGDLLAAEDAGSPQIRCRDHDSRGMVGRNPPDAGEAYEPPDPAERIPGTLREVTQGAFVLETIGFLGNRPFPPSDPAAESDRSRPEIWGTDRGARHYSLFDNLRANSTWSPGHVSDGHEDWRVGWLTKGNAWVASDEECTSARIRIDDLPQWALWRQPDNIELDNDRETARIDLRDETLCTTIIGDTSVSLVRGSRATISLPGQDPEQHFSLVDAVYWQVEGSVKLRAIVEEWIRHFESFSRFMTMRPSVISQIDCRFGESDDQHVAVELIAPRRGRPRQATNRDDDRSSPHNYLTTLRTLEERGINPAEVLAGYWREVATGDAYMAMALHLESQDRLVSRGADWFGSDFVSALEWLITQHRCGSVAL